MDHKKTAEAIKLCGSTPKVDQCKKCVYWSGGDMSECIPRMTEDAAAAMTDLLSRAEAAEAAQETLQRAMVEYKDKAEKAEERANRLEEEVKSYSESDLAKAHDLLSADWAKQKIRAAQAEVRAEKAERERDKAVKTIETIIGSQKYCALCKNTDCKNSITTDATCKPIWSGLEE